MGKNHQLAYTHLSALLTADLFNIQILPSPFSMSTNLNEQFG